MPLTFRLEFLPLRSFKTIAELIINKSSGGRWRYNMLFESLEPDFDDIITIESPLNKTSSVAFKLNNIYKN